MRTSEFTPTDRAVVDIGCTNNRLTHPMAIVSDATMTTDQKRSVLASWASDARAVPDHPSQRRLDNGCLVGIDDILAALKGLDQMADGPNPDELGKRSYLRRHWRTLSRLRRRHRDNGDDDPPTPTPATVPPRPPVLEGGAAVEV